MKSTWEPNENLDDCDEIVQEFEDSLAYSIIGAKPDGSAYAVKFKDGNVQLRPLGEIEEKWPKLMQKYLVDRLRFVMTSNASNGSHDEIESNTVAFTDFDPIRILGEFFEQFN